MLVFVTALRHPNNSNNFQRIEALLEQSVRSVCAQSNENFRVVVVCHGRPRIGFEDHRIAYHIIDFPPPCDPGVPVTDMAIAMRDKGTKFLSGALFAQQFKPTHLAFFDADDLVSRNVAAFVASKPATAGWYVDAGYALDSRTGLVQRKFGLNRFCGTLLVARTIELFRVTGVDARLDARSAQHEILNRIPLPIIKYIYGDHRCMGWLFRKHRLTFEALPFPAAVWVLASGENFSGSRSEFRGVPMSPQFRSEFGLSGNLPSAETPSIRDRVLEMVHAARSKAGALRFRVSGFPPMPVN